MELQTAELVTIRRVCLLWFVWFIPEIESNSAPVAWASAWWLSNRRLGPEPKRHGESYFPTDSQRLLCGWIGTSCEGIVLVFSDVGWSFFLFFLRTFLILFSII